MGSNFHKVVDQIGRASCMEILKISVVAEKLMDVSTLAPVPEGEIPEALPKDEPAVALLPVKSIDSPVSSASSGSRVPKLIVVVPTVVEANSDSLPKPFVPRMERDPSLPMPPKFLLTEKEIETLLTNGEEGRSKLRAETNAYRASIGDWNGRLGKDYLKTWEMYRLRVMEAYEKWSSDLRSASNDELTYALAHNNWSELFEEALDFSEDKMEKGEDAIENRPERNTEVLEAALEKGEKSFKEHRERMEVHSIRMGMHSARMQIHSGRMNVHSGRMQLHSARMQLHNKRMKNHEIIMTALEAELREALVADGLLGKNDKYFRLEVTSDAILFNGKIIDPISQEPKYRAILARYGKGDPGYNKGNTFIIDIHTKGRNIGNYRRN